MYAKFNLRVPDIADKSVFYDEADIYFNTMLLHSVDIFSDNPLNICTVNYDLHSDVYDTVLRFVSTVDCAGIYDKAIISDYIVHINFISFEIKLLEF